LDKIISGGQTGTDRAALDFALDNWIDCGGWCPKYRTAEDGKIPDRYPLKETNSSDPSVRTAANIRDTDGTLIIHKGDIDSGTVFTIQKCIESRKPLIEVDLSERYNLHQAVDWFKQKNIRVVNIAGPRESHSPGLYKEAYRYLAILFTRLSGKAPGQ
jgi:hypothetical protein